MTVGPWQAAANGYERNCEGAQVAWLERRPRGDWLACYRGSGSALWHERGADDLVAAARLANAGLRLLGLACDDTEPSTSGRD